ncbi:uncharacterized protein N7473_000012 [Penicillium subrubescens]|uniref:uncharacterized protein n=1 Tax=Penicillium subrubescens TaxID=1316194 RepID=UPI002545A67B|nr:uncharacterized protein N7473_000012 [Penicillium subrubescens]KAJ5910709.1 hypothetical protein N7473_000012 [Penicillium subrubescens]
MKASIISVISFALAVAALRPKEHSDKPGNLSIIKSQEQCGGGKVSCCSPKIVDNDSTLLSLLDGLNVLGIKDSYCSPISVIGPLNLALLGSVDETKDKFNCQHTVACCNGDDCRPLSEE